MTTERREYQRLHLTRPLDGWFGDYAIRLMDVSATGARIETDEDIPADARGLLRFFWRGQEVEITAETVRRSESVACLRFIESPDLLRQLIADSAAELLRAQHANAMGDRARNVVGDQTLTAVSAVSIRPLAFLVFTFENGAWTKRTSLIAEQPDNGFAVAADEDPEQIEMTCRSYENGDAPTRQLIRMLAELSVAGSSPHPSRGPQSG